MQMRFFSLFVQNLNIHWKVRDDITIHFFFQFWMYFQSFVAIKHQFALFFEKPLIFQFSALVQLKDDTG